MPTTLSKIDVSNMSLSKIGAQQISDFDDVSNPSVVECSLNWQLALAEVSRAHNWNCLIVPTSLTATAQTPLPPVTPVPASTPWAPATVYAAGDYVTYGGQLYQALIANTSSASFINDLTQAFWFETDVFNTNPFDPCNLAGQYASGWAYQYELPADCLLVVTYNNQGQPCAGDEKLWEVMGTSVYSNESTAIIKYVQYNEDCTRYDPLFTACLVLLLASKIATRLRQDDTQISSTCYQQYLKQLAQARVKDSGEARRRLYRPQSNSQWVNSRLWSTNR